MHLAREGSKDSGHGEASGVTAGMSGSLGFSFSRENYFSGCLLIYLSINPMVWDIFLSVFSVVIVGQFC